MNFQFKNGCLSSQGKKFFRSAVNTIIPVQRRHFSPTVLTDQNGIQGRTKNYCLGKNIGLKMRDSGCKLVVGAAIIVISLLTASKAFSSDITELESALHVVQVTETKKLQPFQLVDHNNQIFGLERFAGKWTFIFVGYTSCPDVCPMTADELNIVYKKLDSQSQYKQDTQFLFVSVDPIRDTPQALHNFAGHFRFGLIGATAPVEELGEFTNQLGIFHRRVILEGSTEKEPHYLVEHDSSIYLVNPKLELAAVFPAPHYGKEIKQLYLLLRENYRR